MRCVLVGIGLLLCTCHVSASDDFPRPANLAEIRVAHPINAGALACLTKRGFVVLGDKSVRGLGEAYPAHPRDRHVFVTTDAMLQLWHDLYIEALTDAEREGMAPTLRKAVGRLARASIRLQGSAVGVSARQGLRDAVVLLCVADRLLGGSTSAPPTLRRDVDAEVAKVMAHTAVGRYPADDYTQYTVRGHYAGDAALGRYFRASMWLSRRIMALPAEGGSRADEGLRQAVALADVLRSDSGARRALAELNRARAALAGDPNAISVEQVLTVLEGIHGPRWQVHKALSPSSLQALHRVLSGPSYPLARVHTSSALPGQYPERVIALVPDHAVPDSVLCQRTVFDAVPGRSLPSGRDVAAALGFNVAADDLKRTDPHARAVLASVERNRARLRDDGKSVYKGWLGALGALATADKRAPGFMRTQAWSYEKMNTCLTGWAQIRHANILYAAQPYASYGMDFAPPSGYVEPNPPFFRAAAALADRASSALRRVGGPSKERAALLKAFADKSRELAGYAEAELNGTLTREQGQAIRGFGAWLVQFRVQSKPVIADVATGMGMEVLHVGAGDLNPIIVLPDRESRLGYVGWVGSYYELVRPATQRLADAAWQRMLDSRDALPERPAWAAEFIYTDRGESWQAREPLREAERLFLARKPAEALSLLKRTIESDPHSEVAADCRLRIARRHHETGRDDLAEREWTLCLQMHGGDAWDRARDALREIIWRREANAMPDELKFRSNASRVSRMIGRLRRMPSGAERDRLEREASLIVMRSESLDTATKSKLPGLLSVCRNPAAREALEFWRLAAIADRLQYDSATPGAATFQADAARFLRTARSVRLRAEMHLLALRQACRFDRPPEVVRHLQAYASGVGEDRSEALAVIGQVRAGPTGLGGLVSQVGVELLRHMWRTGPIEGALQIARMLPSAVAEAMCDKLGAPAGLSSGRDRDALVLYASTEGQWSAETAAAWLAIYQLSPESWAAPLALRKAEGYFRRPGGDRARADELRAVAVRRYPEHPVGLLYRADDALVSDRLDEAEALARRAEQIAGASKAAPMHDLELIATSVSQRCAALRGLQELLRPILEPAGRTDLLKTRVLLDDSYRLDALAELAPKAAADVRLALMKTRRDSYFAFHFVRHHPDHAAASEAWAMIRKDVRGGVGPQQPFPEAVAWLVALVNRGASYAYADDAAWLLDRCLPWDVFAYARSYAIALRETAPRTRAAAVASLVEAKALILNHRPEASRDLLRDASAWLAPDDTLSSRISALLACAEESVAAKHRPPWRPLRTYRANPQAVRQDEGGPHYEGESFPDDLSFLLSPGAVNASTWLEHGGVLYLPRSYYDLIALDAKTGARLAIAVTPFALAGSLRPSTEGLILRTGDGEVAVYPWVQPPQR